MRAITSFGPEGYKVYAKRMLEDWVKYSSVPLIAYVEEEGNYPVESRLLWDVPNVKAYVQNTSPSENYRYDVHKFCRKSFVQIQALREFNEPVFWFDADIVLNGKLPNLAPFIENTFIAYMGRKNFYPCSSFVGFNVHEDRSKFVDAYEAIYLTGSIYDIPEWHDAYVFDYVRKKTKVASRDIAKDTGAAGSSNVFDLVFPMGHHKKGLRKYGAKGG